MKTGLLGGSFNPIHNGHLSIAATAIKKLDLDEVWFVPSGNHPLKDQDDLLNFDKRLELICKIIDQFPKYKVSLLDSSENDINYTYNLIMKLKADNPDNQFFFLVGSDIIQELHLWYRHEWLLENIAFAVFRRPGTGMEHHLKDEHFNKLVFINMEPVPISATEIREKIKKDQPIKGLVPPQIEPDIISSYKNL